jgi:hypothetical protein
MKVVLCSLFVGLVLISGCASLGVQNVPPTALYSAKSEIPEEELLDVGIVTFDSVEMTEEEAKEQGTNAQVRKAEEHFIPYHLKSTLQQSSHWGMVRVMPKESTVADVVVKGKIIESNGERLVLQVEARDATGRLWFDRKFGADATEASYANLQPGQKDPFQDLYNAVANTMAEYKEKCTPDQVSTIRTVSKLKFAQEFAPDAFGPYLTRDRKDITQVKRLPADDDPMMKRIMSIRERESMFVDALNGYSENFYNGMWPPYMNWRKANLTERVAMAKVKRDAYMRMAAGVALVALGVLVGSRGDYSAPVLGGTIVLVGGQVFVSGVNISSQAEMHRTAIQELSESFDNEMKPLVMEYQGKTYELTGSAEEQYRQWQELLRQIYYAETGLEDGTSSQRKGAPEKQ